MTASASSALVKGIARSTLVGYCIGALLYPYVAAHFYSVIFGVEALSTGTVIQAGLAAFFVELFFVERKQGLAYLIIFVVLMGYLASGLFYSRASVGDVALILANGGMLFVMLRRRISVPVMYALFLALSGYFFYTIIGGGTALDSLAGNNGVSWVMLQAVVLLYAVLDKEQRSISLLPAMIAFVLCVWATGRSGIVSSALLFVGIAFLYFRHNRLVLGTLPLIPLALLMTGVLGSVIDLASFYFEYFSRLGFDPHDRDELIDYYFGQLNATSVFLGADLTRDAFWQVWGLNPHNSYLLMHSWLGFAAFVLIGLILGAVLRSFFCAKKIYGLLLVVLLLRAATDPLFFLSTLDFLVYYLVVKIYSEPAPVMDRVWSAMAYRVPKPS